MASKGWARLYWILKVHKTPYGKRFISSMSSCVSQPVGEWIAKALKVLELEEHRLWIDKVMNSGLFAVPPLGAWMVSSAQKVPDRIRLANSLRAAEGTLGATQVLMSVDFAGMYTRIKHQPLLDALDWVIDKCFARRVVAGQQLVLWLPARQLTDQEDCDSCWMSEADAKARVVKQPHSRLVTAARLRSWIRLLLNNLFVTVGNGVFRQRSGIPMGAAPCVFFAVAFCFACEYRFLKRQLAFARNEHEGFGSLSPMTRTLIDTLVYFVVRYVDDLQTFRSVDFMDLVDEGLYFDWLPLVVVTDGARGTFLHLWIRQGPAGVYTTMYFKWDFLPLTPRRMPCVSSAISLGAMYGVITSQLTDLERCTMTFDAFVEGAVRLLVDLHDKGYARIRVWAKLSAYSRKWLRPGSWNAVKARIWFDVMHCLDEPDRVVRVLGGPPGASSVRWR